MKSLFAFFVLTILVCTNAQCVAIVAQPTPAAVVWQKRQMTEGPSALSQDPSQIIQQFSSLITIPAYYTPFAQDWTNSGRLSQLSSIYDQRFGTLTGDELFSSLESIGIMYLSDSSLRMSILANTQTAEVTSTDLTTTTASPTSLNTISSSTVTTSASNSSQSANHNGAISSSMSTFGLLTSTICLTVSIFLLVKSEI